MYRFRIFDSKTYMDLFTNKTLEPEPDARETSIKVIWKSFQLGT